MIYICGHPKFRFLGCMKYVCLMGANCLSNWITTYLSKLRKRCNIIHLTSPFLRSQNQKIPLIGQGVSPSALIMLVQYPPVSSNLVSHEMPELNGGVFSGKPTPIVFLDICVSSPEGANKNVAIWGSPARSASFILRAQRRKWGIWSSHRKPQISACNWQSMAKFWGNILLIYC